MKPINTAARIFIFMKIVALCLCLAGAYFCLYGQDLRVVEIGLSICEYAYALLFLFMVFTKSTSWEKVLYIPVLIFAGLLIIAVNSFAW